jgi:hypothetical protein
VQWKSKFKAKLGKTETRSPVFVAKLSEDNCRAALVQAQTEVSSSQRL